MDIKKASALYFSPTGGTKKIAERIAERVCESADFLDVTVRAQELDFGPGSFHNQGIQKLSSEKRGKGLYIPQIRPLVFYISLSPAGYSG